MEMINPDARKQLKSMLEHQILERQKADSVDFSPNKLKVMQIRENNLRDIQNNRSALKPPISRFNLYNQTNSASISQLPALHQNTSTPTGNITELGKNLYGASPIRGGA